MGCIFSKNSTASRSSSNLSVNRTLLEETTILTEEQVFEFTVQTNVNKPRQTVKIVGLDAAERFITDSLRYDVYGSCDRMRLKRTRKSSDVPVRRAESSIDISTMPTQCLAERRCSFDTYSEVTLVDDIAVDKNETDACMEFQPHVLVDNRGFFSFDPLQSTFHSMPSVRIADVTVVSSCVSAFCLESTFKSDSAGIETATNGTLLINSDDEEKAIAQYTPIDGLDDVCSTFNRKTLTRSSTFRMVDFAKKAESGSFLPSSGDKINDLRQRFKWTVSLCELPFRPQAPLVICSPDEHLDMPALQKDSNSDTEIRSSNDTSQMTFEHTSSPILQRRRRNMRMLKAKAEFHVLRDTGNSLPALHTAENLFTEVPELSTSEQFLVHIGGSERAANENEETSSNSFRFLQNVQPGARCRHNILKLYGDSVNTLTSALTPRRRRATPLPFGSFVQLSSRLSSESTLV